MIDIFKIEFLGHSRYQNIITLSIVQAHYPQHIPLWIFSQ